MYSLCSHASRRGPDLPNQNVPRISPVLGKARLDVELQRPVEGYISTGEPLLTPPALVDVLYDVGMSEIAASDPEPSS